MFLDDEFFEEGTLLCRLLQEKYWFIPETDSHMESDFYKIDCQIQGCFQQFATLSR